MISWGQILELREDVGYEGFDEVVAIFLEEVEETLRQLSHSPRLAEDLHALKGSAMTLGFNACAALCDDGEKLACAGHTEQVDIDAIRAVYSDSKVIFLAELPSRLAA